MIGKICEVVEVEQGRQLQIGYPNLKIGSLVLITRDLGGGFFYAFGSCGSYLINSQYLSVCQALSGSVD